MKVLKEALLGFELFDQQLALALCSKSPVP